MFDIERWTVTRRPGKPTEIVKTCKSRFENEADLRKAMYQIKSICPNGYYYTDNGDLAHEAILCEQRFVKGIGLIEIEEAIVLTTFYANDRFKAFWCQQLRRDI